MTARRDDGSAGDADYGQIGASYAAYRRPDPRIAAAILSAVGSARTILNVGAGAGSYEPVDRQVTAVEPSESMRAQRPTERATAVDATAENLPFPDRSFDAAMTTFSIHQWGDLDAGLREMRRVTRGPVVILTCDPALLDRFWLAEYAPGVISAEAGRYPPIAAIARVLGDVEVTGVPIPLDCVDGFNEAYYGRPEALLDPLARTSCSAWSFVDERTAAAYVDRLAADLADGGWDRRHGDLRTQPTFDGSLVLVVSRPAATPRVP
ncbi:class I SAM-dependent methyltransferase [Pengzhenrongella sicca]|uniref:Methyltransferase domain-containing protein n=1 Tax=Pengzhenrongella sicca TaxID=2819238 RepID=A0A8A4ZAG2_9MICO|nr:class I SAM-dependent methyltransferase [Pengzhenrongella sicca]QTE28411.1 methyltransferase domain-containing protein [Pengzhenrongella sicca]